MKVLAVNLVNILMENDSFNMLEHFVPLLHRLRAVNAPMPSFTTAIELLATVDKFSLAYSDFAISVGGPQDALKNLSAGARLRFFDSVLYRGFLQRRLAAALELARKADSAASRTVAFARLVVLGGDDDNALGGRLAIGRARFHFKLSFDEKV